MKHWLWRFLLRHDPLDSGYRTLLNREAAAWSNHGKGWTLFAYEIYGDIVDGKVVFR